MAHPPLGPLGAVARRRGAGDSLLASYVVPATDDGVDVAELAEFAARRLPRHMLPTRSWFSVAARHPRRQASTATRCPNPTSARPTAPYRARALPRGAGGAVFARSPVRDRVGLDTTSSARCNSLGATRVVARLNRALRSGLDVRDRSSAAPRDGSRSARRSARVPIHPLDCARGVRPERPAAVVGAGSDVVRRSVRSHVGRLQRAEVLRLTGTLDTGRCVPH
ncbi:hypothetical protein GS531_24700 [Rhodococcus hoagii]|nr:hypothetical protein [Prescottella equi]